MTDEAWIDTVRLARDFGTVDLLFPEGITDVRDLPHPLFDAIRQAEVYLGWEELPKDEQPPKRYWQNPDKLTEWFDAVERKRRDEAGGSTTNSIEDPVQNEAAKGLLVG